MLGNVSIKIIHQKISFSFHGKSLVARGCGWQKTHHWREPLNKKWWWIHHACTSPLPLPSSSLKYYAISLCIFVRLTAKPKFDVLGRNLQTLSTRICPFSFLEEFKLNQLLKAWKIWAFDKLCLIRCKLSKSSSLHYKMSLVWCIKGAENGCMHVNKKTKKESSPTFIFFKILRWKLCGAFFFFFFDTTFWAEIKFYSPVVGRSGAVSGCSTLLWEGEMIARQLRVHVKYPLQMLHQGEWFWIFYDYEKKNTQRGS